MSNSSKNIVITLAVLVISLFIFELFPIDIAIQDHFYIFQEHRWILDRDDELTRLLFYDGIKKVYIAFTIVALISLFFIKRVPALKIYKQGMIILLISCISIPLLVGGLKAVTNTPCPKNIGHYGGDYPYVSVFSKYPKNFHNTKKVKCYPAGHASGGFALLSLFFLFRKRRNRLLALGFALVIGWTIGLYKMFIGDHFFSHTFITMLLAWLVILVIARVVQRFNAFRMRHSRSE
ncbi:MAG: phosphatase PAP2 family protein [Candidatus Thiodiazotropha sp.]